MIRTAERKDAARIAEIYSYYVEETAISFEYEAPDAKEMARRMAEFGKEYPYIVYEEEGRILGYAYAHRFLPREAYRHCVEMTIYLDREETMGIGAALGFDFALARKVGDFDFHSIEDGNFTLSPAVSFQYRLELNRDMDLRLGAGLMYSHTFGYSGGNDVFSGSGFTGSLKLTANADFVYQIDDWGIIAGADMEMAVWNFAHGSVNSFVGSNSETTTLDYFGLVITPKFGASYSF